MKKIALLIAVMCIAGCSAITPQQYAQIANELVTIGMSVADMLAASSGQAVRIAVPPQTKGLRGVFEEAVRNPDDGVWSFSGKLYIVNSGVITDAYKK